MTNPVADFKSGQISGQIQAQPQIPAAEFIHTPVADPSSEPLRQPLSVQQSAHHKTGILPALQSLLHLIVIAIFIITFCAQPFRIPSESMESTLLVGDFLLVNKQAALPNAPIGPLPSTAIHRGDIVVFHDPVDATLHLVKRVIGIVEEIGRAHV